MEVATFRQRAQLALEQKAKRGELFRRVAVGYVRSGYDRIEKDPDERVRSVIDLVFRKFAELGTARRLYLWLCQQQIQLPTAVRGAGTSRTVSWSAPRYHSLLSLLKNPIYAGVYAYGRSRATVRLEQGRKRIVRRKHQREEWAVFLPNHHEGYISWAVHENNQALLANNANAKGDIVRGSIRRDLQQVEQLIRKSRDAHQALREQFAKLWLSESKPYALDRTLDRYANAVSAYESLLRKVSAAQAGRQLPSPAEVGLVIPKPTPQPK
jgi:hypothetical protein